MNEKSFDPSRIQKHLQNIAEEGEVQVLADQLYTENAQNIEGRGGGGVPKAARETAAMEAVRQTKEVEAVMPLAREMAEPHQLQQDAKLYENAGISDESKIQTYKRYNSSAIGDSDEVVLEKIRGVIEEARKAREHHQQFQSSQLPSSE